MKRFVLLFLMISLFLAFASNGKIKDYLKQYKIDQVQRSEFFNNLSQKYYGTPKFGNELAIINQKLELKQDTAEYEIIVPSIKSVKRLYENYDISLADEIIQNLNSEKNGRDYLRGQIQLFQSSVFASILLFYR